MKQKIGRSNLSASFIARKALRIAFGFGHPEVSELALFRIAPFLMTDDERRHSMKTGKPAHQRRVVSKTPVAMKPR
jgi:hypothetical protein